MNFYLQLLEKNYILTVSATAWIIAQLLKVLIDLFSNKKFNSERIFGAGGMPSTHSALVCAMVISTGKLLSTTSNEFAFAMILAGIVMYDAMGVRRETGKQAKVLNTLILDWMDNSNFKDNINLQTVEYKKLKELVGHTPFEVIAGAILGMIIGFIVPLP